MSKIKPDTIVLEGRPMPKRIKDKLKEEELEDEEHATKTSEIGSTGKTE